MPDPSLVIYLSFEAEKGKGQTGSEMSLQKCRLCRVSTVASGRANLMEVKWEIFNILQCAIECDNMNVLFKCQLQFSSVVIHWQIRSCKSCQTTTKVRTNQVEISWWDVLERATPNATGMHWLHPIMFIIPSKQLCMGCQQYPTRPSLSSLLKAHHVPHELCRRRTWSIWGAAGQG